MATELVRKLKELSKERRDQQKISDKEIIQLSKQNKQKTIYKKSMNRSMAVIDCQCWYLGEKIALPKISNNAMFFDPLFIYRPTKGVDVYYDYTDVTQDEKFLVDYFRMNVKEFHNIVKQYENDGRRMIELSKRKRSEDLTKLFNLIVDFWGKLVVIMTLAESKKIDKHISKKSYNLRKQYDTVLYQAGESLLQMAKQKIPYTHAKYKKFLTLEEIESKQLPEIKELEKRKQGYVFFKNNLNAVVDIEKFEQDQNLNIVNAKYDTKKTSKIEIKGNSACAGKVIGIAKIVFEYSQLKKVKNGDVLVAPMTTPDFLPAMKRAIAFVTDEGGITSHAAIVAREMNKPCIIGTKISTEVLKDGNLLEIDGNKGLVSVLK